MPVQILENPETERIIGFIKTGVNMFITGPGGTGKSTFIRGLAEDFDNVHITAMTGCAALLLECGAKTLHSWAGIGLGKDSIEKCIESIKRKTHVKKRWTGARILVIDEVSMLTPELFERLDKIGRALRKQPGKPFGGLQIILVGDFCQLPPIPKDLSGADVELKFLFESEIWDSSIHTIVSLTKIWRQKDPIYQQVLNEVRMGLVSSESEQILRSRMNTNWKDESIKPTVLFSRNNDVDKVNEVNMKALESTVHVFTAQTVIDKSKWTDTSMAMPDKTSDLFHFAESKLDNDASYSVLLELKIGTQVMLLVNTDIESGLVNGSRGIIVDFDKLRKFPIVKFKKGEPRIIEPYTWYSHDLPHIGRQQIPLRVAYAITIHKSQGASIDSALVDIGKSTFEYGQAYVALSRVRSLEGLHVFALDLSKIKTHPRVLDFYRRLQNGVTSSTLVTGNTSTGTVTGTATDAWSLSGVDNSWLPTLSGLLNSPSGKVLSAFISQERKTKNIFPPAESVFHCLSIPLDSVKVVILGQDPYHGAGQAMGLSFSVPDTCKAPPSLKNILKEVTSDIGEACYHSNLSGWFNQGVLLLNTILTVEEGKPLSHVDKGWEQITDAIIKLIVANNTGCVFMLWGKQAQKKAELIDVNHSILMAAHPSPLSAHNGFFGCKHFSKANDLLGVKAIKWT